MERTCPVCNSQLDATDSRCPACGFKLLGGTEEFQPITIDGQSLPTQAKQPKMTRVACLTVISGPQIGTAYLLDDKQLSVGRSPKCDIFLNDMTVSREHATITPSNGGFVITDSQSYNGIWINNVSIDSARLKDGDIVQIGAFCLKFDE